VEVLQNITKRPSQATGLTGGDFPMMDDDMGGAQVVFGQT